MRHMQAQASPSSHVWCLGKAVMRGASASLRKCQPAGKLFASGVFLWGLCLHVGLLDVKILQQCQIGHAVGQHAAAGRLSHMSGAELRVHTAGPLPDSQRKHAELLMSGASDGSHA